MASIPSPTLRSKHERSGQALVVIVMFVVVFCAFAVLSVDFGKLYHTKKILQNGTDAASLAGVMEAVGKPASDTTFETKAKDFAVANKVTIPEITQVLAGTWSASSGFTAGATPRDAVLVSAQRTVPMTFARIFGIRELPVSATSVAQAFASDSITGVAMPWAIDTYDPLNPPSRCQEVTLRFSSAPNGGAWTETPSNNSGNVYEERIRSGYEGTLSVGDIIYSVQGVKTGVNRQETEARIGKDPGATCDTVANNSERLVILPYVALGTFSGGSGTWSQAEVLGFVVFFLERTEDNGKVVIGKYREAFAGTSVSKKPPTPGTPSVALLVE
jgi:Flp pilus assembly protein TadG